MRLHSALAASMVLAGVAPAVFAAPASFIATLSVQVGTLPPVIVHGSGVGDSGPGGGTFSMPAGVFSIGETQILPTPLLGIVFGFAVAGPGQAGKIAPFADGSNKALAFDGVTGTMGLDASAYLLNAKNKAIAGVPLSIIGVGTPGTLTFVAIPGFPSGTIHANPYQLGMVTVMGEFGGTPSTLAGTGFDNRGIDGVGTLQLVSPTLIDLGGLGSLAALATLSINVPEPATFVLLAAGLGALGLLARRSS